MVLNKTPFSVKKRLPKKEKGDVEERTTREKYLKTKGGKDFARWKKAKVRF